MSLHFKQFYKKKRKISQALGSQWIRLVLMSCVFSVLGAHSPALSAATLWWRSSFRQRSTGPGSETRLRAPEIKVMGRSWSQITALSRTDSPSSSTQTSPWLWEESDPGPRHRGSHPDGSHPEATACSNQDAPVKERVVTHARREPGRWRLFHSLHLEEPSHQGYLVWSYAWVLLFFWLLVVSTPPEGP